MVTVEYLLNYQQGLTEYLCCMDCHATHYNLDSERILNEIKAVHRYLKLISNN